MTVRKLLAATSLSLALAAPAYAGVLGLGGSGNADIGLGGGATGAHVGLGTSMNTGAGGMQTGAHGSTDMGATMSTPEVDTSAKGAARARSNTAETAEMRAEGKLAAMGYSNVKLANKAAASAGSDLKFDAINPEGQNVRVSANAKTGAIVGEESGL